MKLPGKKNDEFTTNLLYFGSLKYYIDRLSQKIEAIKVVVLT